MFRAGLVWVCAAIAIGSALTLAALSPLLAWREPVYILGGFAGVAALALMLVQPLLIMDGPSHGLGRRMHRWVGAGLVLLTGVHVGGLWITSPPDVIDALLFRSPTPFAVWGVLAMWAVVLSTGLALLRRRIGLRRWRWLHARLAFVIVIGTALHAILIQGAMEPVSKAILCGLVILALGRTLWALGHFPMLRRGTDSS